MVCGYVADGFALECYTLFNSSSPYKSEATGPSQCGQAQTRGVTLKVLWVLWMLRSYYLYYVQGCPDLSVVRMANPSLFVMLAEVLDFFCVTGCI